MFLVKILLFSSIFIVGFCSDLDVGVSVNNQLAFSERVELSSIPIKIRTKNVFYSDPNNKIIKGIQAFDLDYSAAKATITAGGVGFTFANIKLKSERGSGLNYQVFVFI